MTCLWMTFRLPQISKLIEYYQQLAHREKQERDRKKLARRRQCMPLAFSVLCSPLRETLSRNSFQKCHIFFFNLLKCQTAVVSFVLFSLRSTVKDLIHCSSVSGLGRAGVTECQHTFYLKKEELLWFTSDSVSALIEILTLCPSISDAFCDRVSKQPPACLW